MSLRQQLRWSGWLIILFAVLMNGMNIIVYLGYHTPLTQSLYGIGFTGLIFACMIIHIGQTRKSGTFGLVAALISVLSLYFANVVNFLTLADLAGIEGADHTFLGLWDPVMRMAVYSTFIGGTLFGVSIAQAGVFPRWAGIFIALGVALQWPPQYAIAIAGPLFYFFTIAGSILLGAGLVWIGVVLASGNSWIQELAGLSNLDRNWGGALVIFTGLLLAVDASLNMFGQLSLTSGMTHLLSYTALLLAAFILYAAHGEKVGWIGFAGFLLTQLGAALYIVTAYLIAAQLAGAIGDNRMLMASWQDIPVGRYGGYSTTLGAFLLGVEAVRSGVFPRWSGWLVIIGIAIALPFQFTIQAYYLGIFWVLGAIIEGLGFAWMGWTLLDRRQVREVIQLHETTQ